MLVAALFVPTKIEAESSVSSRTCMLLMAKTGCAGAGVGVGVAVGLGFLGGLGLGLSLVGGGVRVVPGASVTSGNPEGEYLTLSVTDSLSRDT